MRHARLRLGLAIALTSGTASLQASPQITEIITPYTVSLERTSDFFRKLDSASPIRSGRTKRHSDTEWDIYWNFAPKAGPDGCRLTRIVTEAVVTQTLPRVLSLPADPKVRLAFEEYEAAMQRHALHQLQLALDAATEVEQYFQSLPSSPSCRAIAKQANSEGCRIVARYREQDAPFDRAAWETSRNKTAQR
ncbi:MAG: DUF922 domain-containing protein [Burkholderiaceae bacterium]